MGERSYQSHSVDIREAENGVIVEVRDSSSDGYNCKTFVGASRAEALERAGESGNSSETRTLRQPLSGAMAQTIFSNIGKK